ncbi:hypothetical protein BDZ97DRAFT_1773861 [Flammula alnicola]|nr:hypothetical protein BDZ97DRAFT_1773861 [Flammula alnicola]
MNYTTCVSLRAIQEKCNFSWVFCLFLFFCCSTFSRLFPSVSLRFWKLRLLCFVIYYVIFIFVALLYVAFCSPETWMNRA